MKLEDIKLIGLVGGGVMGGGIAQTAIMAGYKAIIRDLTPELCARARDTILNGRFGLKGGIERGKYTQEQVDKAMLNLSTTTKLEDLKDCDLIIEAIRGGTPEELERKSLKLEIFNELDKIVKKDSIFATNTSKFTIADIAVAVNRKDKFIGMHWFSPANIMKLIEITYTKDTTEDVIQVLECLCKRFGKTSVRVKDVPGDTGFIANRIFLTARKEAQKIVDEGIATEEDVDIAMELGYNWPAGPLRLLRNVRGGWQKK